MKLIGMTGPARAGKDTVSHILWEKYKTSGYGFADPLKDAAQCLLGISDAKVEGEDYDREQIMPEWGFSVRHFLQKLGTEGTRDLFREDFWLVRMQKELDYWDEIRGERGTDGGGTCISDVRFDNEAEFIRDRGGEVWHITRDESFKSGLDKEAKDHASEKGVAFKPEDRMILNNGTIDDLEQRVAKLWAQYG